MDFTQERLKKLASSNVGEVYEGITHNFYDVKEPSFSEKEKKLASALIRFIQRKESSTELGAFEELPDEFYDSFRDEVISAIEIGGLLERLPSRKVFVSLAESMIKLLAGVSFIQDKSLFSEYVLHNSIGLKQLAFFSLDDDLEELMVNGLDSVFVFHRKHGMCKTGMRLEEKPFMNLVHKIALSVGKEFDPKNPLLDARLPDGSRVNATTDDVSPKGISMTIRKFSTIPMTMLDLIEKGTIPSDVAAFLWTMVDGMGVTPQNIIVAGGTASGKTTFLNVLSNFSRLSERIVSIEDTLELSLLNRENWVALEARHSFGEEVTMDALLKNALRMRPDRIIVGEVRGAEALTLFTAMDNGHAGCMGTIHANDPRETVVKLQERPFSVPTSMIPLVDLIVVMQRRYSKEKGMQRRVMQIAEVSRMEAKVLLANIYEFNDAEGVLKRTEVPSRIIEDVASKNSMTKNDLRKEIDLRQMVLEWMLRKNIRKPLEVLEVMQSYYYNPKKVLSAIQSFEE